jgi:hypothetical protein
MGRWICGLGIRVPSVVLRSFVARFWQPSFPSGLRPDTSLRDRGRRFGGRSQSELGHGYFNSTTPRRPEPPQSGERPVLSGSKWHLGLTLAPRRFPADEQPETGTTRLFVDWLPPNRTVDGFVFRRSPIPSRPALLFPARQPRGVVWGTPQKSRRRLAGRRAPALDPALAGRTVCRAACAR